MSAKKVNKVATEYLVFVFFVVILLLSALNITNYLAPKKVLGAETLAPDTTKFWDEFLSKNPNYAPGWQEIGRTDKVNEIDPNFQIR